MTTVPVVQKGETSRGVGESSGASAGPRVSGRWPAGVDWFCLGCGYDLRGMAEEPGRAPRCPECGRRFDRSEQAGLRAPWVQRNRLGVMAAYWRTVWLVTFRPHEFAERFDWPHVRHHGSTSFRNMTVACATVSVTTAAAAAAWEARFSGVGVAVVLSALLPSAAVFFYGATELAGFFAGPRLSPDSSEEAFRAGVVNDYASAALAWTPLPALAACAAAAAGRVAPGHAADYALAAALLLTVAVCVLWVGDVLVLFGKALELRTGGVVLAAVLFPLRIAGVAVLTILFVFAPIACCVGGLISLRP